MLWAGGSGSTAVPTLCAHALALPRRIVRKVPELLEQFQERAPDLLADKNHSVVLAGTALMLQVGHRGRTVLEGWVNSRPGRDGVSADWGCAGKCCMGQL